MRCARCLERIALLSLILIATALRLYRLNAQDIWGDEAFSIFLSQQPLSFVMAGASDTHPPFYPLLLFSWLRQVGTSAFGVRALSALVGILAIPLIFILAKRLTPRPRVPWFAAILATVSPLLIYYSQETRMYGLVAVLALASAALLPPLLGRLQLTHDSRRQRIREILNPRETVSRKAGAYWLMTLLALYTHYSAFFVLAAENVFAFVKLGDRAARIRWLVLQALLVAAYVPWILVQVAFLSGKANSRFDEWSWRGIEMIFGKAILAFSGGLTVEFPAIQVAGVVSLFFAAWGGLGILRSRPYRSASSPTSQAESLVLNDDSIFAPIYFLVPVFIAFVVNPVMPFFFERYVLVALPGFILTVALGLDELANMDRRAAVGITGLFVLIGLFSLANYYFDDAYAKGKYGQMMAHVTQNAQPGDALVLNNPLQKPLYRYYGPKNIPAFFLPDGVPLEDPVSRQALEDIAQTHSRLWLVMFGNPSEYDPTSYLSRWLGVHAFKTFFRGFVDASLYLYVMPRAEPAIRHPLYAKLGDSIQLVGYDLDRAEVSAGQTLLLTLHWRVDSSPGPQSYVVFAHVIGAVNPAAPHSPVWAQMDGEPVGGSRPTSSWQPGERIDDRYGLLVPAGTPPGEYLIEVGMYDPATLARLVVVDEKGARVEDDRVILGAIRVVGQQ